MNLNSTYISRIFVDGIRCFKDFEVDLTSNLNIFVGPNAVGKSTLLQIMAYFLDGNFLGNKNFFSVTNLFSSYYSEDHSKVPYIVFETSEVELNSSFLKDVWSDTMVCALTKNNENCMVDIKKILVDDTRDKPIVREGLLKLHDMKNSKVKFLLVLIGSGSSHNERVLVRVDNDIYYVYQSRDLDARKILQKLRIKSLAYNYADFKSILFKTLENKKAMSRHFNKVVEDSTTIINNLSKSDDYRYVYDGNPEMSRMILDGKGKDIQKASSGEQQLNNLNVFFETIEEVGPSIVIIDEPELHLNYSQLPFVISKIKKLSHRGVQVLIATHSTFFIRWTKVDCIKLLKTSDTFTRHVKLQNKRLLQKYLTFPEIFFCRKIIAVESTTDKIFFERTLGVLSKHLNKMSLDQRNIEIVAGYGKAYMHSLYDLSKDLGTDYFFVVDLDFFLQETDFDFFGKEFVRSVNTLKRKMVRLDDKESGIRTFSLNSEVKTTFFKLVNKIFNQGTLTEDDKKLYQMRYKKLIEKYVYERKSGLLKVIKDFQIGKIRTIFRKQNVWLLGIGSIDDYINSSLKEGEKLSIDKLQLNYYPSSISELNAFMSRNAISEFKRLAEEIARWDI